MWSRTSFSIRALALAGLLCGLASVAAGQSPRELRAGLEEYFALVPLSNGLLLQPLDPAAGPRAVEVSNDGIALDGELVGRDELRLRLGDESAELVLAVAELDDAGRRALLTAEPSAPPMPPTPAAPPTMDTEESAAMSAQEARERAREDLQQAREEARRVRPSKKATYRRSGDAEVAVGSSVVVGSDEVTDDVVVVGGLLKVEGRVEGDATVFGGSATIEGEVTGDVNAIGGPVRLEEGSHVHGDVTSVGSKVYRDEGARVDGDIEQVPFNANLSFGPWSDWRNWKDKESNFDFHVNPWHWWSGLGWSVVKLVFLIALAWLSLLIAPSPIDRMERRIESEPWKTGLVGLLAQVLFFPLLILLVIFLAISIIGIPLLLILPFALLALLIAGWFGFVAVAGRVGSWARERFGWELGSPYWVVLVGLVAIFALSAAGDLLDFGIAPMRFIAGMFIFFGVIVTWAAWTIGCGAAVLTRFGTASSWDRAEDLVTPLPPLPESAEAGEAGESRFEEPGEAGTTPDDES